MNLQNDKVTEDEKDFIFGVATLLADKHQNKGHQLPRRRSFLVSIALAAQDKSIVLVSGRGYLPAQPATQGWLQQ